MQCNNANVQHQLCINGYAQRNNGVVASIEWIRNAHYFAQFYTYNKVTGIIHITILYDMMEYKFQILIYSVACMYVFTIVDQSSSVVLMLCATTSQFARILYTI